MGQTKKKNAVGEQDSINVGHAVGTRKKQDTCVYRKMYVHRYTESLLYLSKKSDRKYGGRKRLWYWTESRIMYEREWQSGNRNGSACMGLLEGCCVGFLQNGGQI